MPITNPGLASESSACAVEHALSDKRQLSGDEGAYHGGAETCFAQDLTIRVRALWPRPLQTTSALREPTLRGYETGHAGPAH